jgi:hypothetical protein
VAAIKFAGGVNAEHAVTLAEKLVIISRAWLTYISRPEKFDPDPRNTTEQGAQEAWYAKNLTLDAIRLQDDDFLVDPETGTKTLNINRVPDLGGIDLGEPKKKPKATVPPAANGDLGAISDAINPPADADEDNVSKEEVEAAKEAAFAKKEAEAAAPPPETKAMKLLREARERQAQRKATLPGGETVSRPMTRKEVEAAQTAAARKADEEVAALATMAAEAEDEGEEEEYTDEEEGEEGTEE